MPNPKHQFIQVKTMAKLLEELDPEAVMVLSCDSEGNRFRPMQGYSDDASPEELELDEVLPANIPNPIVLFPLD